jgi:hypothetical protein
VAPIIPTIPTELGADTPLLTGERQRTVCPCIGLVFGERMY